MRLHEKHFEIPQVCLDLGFEDRSYHNDQSARMYNSQLDLTLWVNEPSAGKKPFVLRDCEDGTLGEVETDKELCELVAFARSGHDAMPSNAGHGKGPYFLVCL